MTTTRARWPRVLAFAVGAAAASLVLVAGRLPAQHPGLDLSVSANRTGELDVSPAGLVLDANGLTPSEALPPARVAVRNITGASQQVSVATAGGGSSAEAGLAAVVTAGDQELYRGPLVALAAGSAPFRLASGERVDVVLQLSASGAENPPGIVDLDLEITAATSAETAGPR